MTIRQIDHFDFVSGRGRSINEVREERLPSRLLRMIEWFQGKHERRRSRNALRRLDDHQLADIGLSREEAEAEASRDFWD